jgi:hypothetical protein
MFGFGDPASKGQICPLFASGPAAFVALVRDEKKPARSGLEANEHA